MPGCPSPGRLWEVVAQGGIQVGPPPAGGWRIRMDRVLRGEPGKYLPDATWSQQGGYVEEEVEVDPEFQGLDPVFRWTLEAAQQALSEVADKPLGARAGLTLGNLSFPTREHTRLAEQFYFRQLTGRELPAQDVIHPKNRFMSGLPAISVARALGLHAGALALDAACASGLYAIKVACDRLHAGEADLMLAGAVNAADQLFLHMGFSALRAMSHTGQSRPFHRDADGLVPAEGAAFVALKRLDDAEADGDNILGVIRGVGLSNDGRTGGFLSPSAAGQVRSMEVALSESGLRPHDIQYVECHATGTPVGDAIELESLSRVYGRHPLALGSLKANLGHLLTASGVAGLLKTLRAMEEGVIPGTPGSRPLTGALDDTSFSIPDAAIPWEPKNGIRTAGVSSFGFGGNNAHLLVQQYRPGRGSNGSAGSPERIQVESTRELAIIGVGLRTHLDANTAAFARRILGDGEHDPQFNPKVLTLPARRLAFPPAELKEALGQQLLLLEVLEEATQGLPPLDPVRSGIFVGMQTDSEACRYGLRWRWPDLVEKSDVRASPAWVKAAQDALAPPLGSAGVIGKMPNITANRLNSLRDLCGVGFAVSREELSGDAALELAMAAISRGELDTALVAAVDLSREPVHEWAARELLGEARAEAADAAVMLVVKDRGRAEADGDPILGFVSPHRPGEPQGQAQLRSDAPDSPIQQQLGHSHAASGLLHIVLGHLMTRCGTQVHPDGTAQPLLPEGEPLAVEVENRSFTGETAHWRISAPTGANRPSPHVPPLRGWGTPSIFLFAARDRPQLLDLLEAGEPGGAGPVRLAVVCRPQELSARLDRARQRLSTAPESPFWDMDGTYFRESPLEGELAFAFTGAASAYPGMGKELLLALPQLLDGMSGRLKDPAALADWAYLPDDPRATLPFYQLAGSSFLCQLHAEASLRLLGLKPDVSLGLSSGETNAMFALGVWGDMDGLFQDIQESGLYTSALANTFQAVREHWKLNPHEEVVWESHRVRAPAEKVLEAAEGTPRAYVTIVNTPTDVVIGGDAAACQALLKALGSPPSVALGHELAIHCEAVTPWEEPWRRLHTRPSAPVDHIRFYSNYFGGVFQPHETSVADALTGQALQTLDFPHIVELAWNDSVRLFVEHGPRNSLASAVSDILGSRDHLAVSLDRPGVSSVVQLHRVAAELWCAGVPVDLKALRSAFALPTPFAPNPDEPSVSFDLRPPGIHLPPLTPATELKPVKVAQHANGGGLREGRQLPPAPTLAPTSLGGRPGVARVPREAPQEVRQPIPAPPKEPTGVHGMLVEGHRQMAEVHAEYLQAQSRALQAFQDSMGRMRAMALGLAPAHPAVHEPAPSEPAPFEPLSSEPLSPEPTVHRVAAPVELPAAPLPPDVPADQPVQPSEPPAPRRSSPGPSFSREDLVILAGGQISSVFGKSFAGQDEYPIQVRMPEPPLLLCDRVLGIEGDAHSMGQGSIWTETDVRNDSWYLHHGRMPAGVFIECGQADLLLISWLGIDAFNKGERAYRLLGCDLVFHGPPPEPGETLEYDIHIDGHARQGQVRLFFFHYDCRINGELRLSVRNGQAGFFSVEELENSAGVIWKPESGSYTDTPRMAPPPATPKASRFSKEEVEAYLEGDLEAAFGPPFFPAHAHTRTPRTPSGSHNFLGEVTELDFQGGPAGRGYLRVETPVRGDEWFFDGHFKNDPCMPGTLMADACLQAMSFYMAAAGWTLPRDGWRFQPVTEESYRFQCRGQVTPTSKEIIYEIFVDEMFDDEGLPTLFAHVLCTVDGRKAFLCERLGLQLVPDWPLSSMPQLIQEDTDSRPVAHLGDFPLDYNSLLHCAWGMPTRAFGQGFAHYNGPRRSPRLPGPPYHFMTRITHLEGQMGVMKPGARVTTLYDIPPDAWYFQENGAPTMPNCVLMEAALQPCGWLASFTLDTKASRKELLFRNLDGESVQHREVVPTDGTLETQVELLSVSQVGDLIIEKFSVRCRIAGEEVLALDTAFGFFPPEAMISQKGFGAEAQAVARLQQPSDSLIPLRDFPPELFRGTGNPSLPPSRLLMLDRITGHWPEGGPAGLGAIRGEMDVDPSAWFFKAHFYQDPVQPGSLGIEAMLQAVQALMLLQGKDTGLEPSHFEPIRMNDTATWHYRGQVTPEKGTVSVEFQVTEEGVDEGGPWVVGEAQLWVDGLQIYQAPRLGMRIVGDSPDSQRPEGSREPHEHSPAMEVHWTIDLSDPQFSWIRDHCPTYTIPALPMTYLVEMMVEAAAPHFPGMILHEVIKAQARQWVSFPTDVSRGRTRVELGDEEGEARVTVERTLDDGSFVAAADGQLRFAPSGETAWEEGLGPLRPLRGAVSVPAPYSLGNLFHGPSLQLMTDLRLGENGAWAILDMDAAPSPAAGPLPRGQLNPGLMDAALHCIPHDALHLWAPEIDAGMAAYPLRLEGLQVRGDLSKASKVTVEARHVEVASGRFPRSHVRITSEGRLMAAFDLVEVLLPKGRLGLAPPLERLAFLRDGKFQPNVALARVSQEESTLTRSEVQGSDWLPGTLSHVYGLPRETPPDDLLREVAIRDHVAAHIRLHPSQVRVGRERGTCLNLPLNRFRVSATAEGEAVRVTSGAPAPLAWESILRDWLRRNDGKPSFATDLGVSLMRKFVRRVVLSDPEGFVGLRGRPVLYMANHQVAVESFLFLALAATLAQTPAGAIAKDEHRASWIGKLHALSDLTMGDRNPLRMLFFQRQQQSDMLRLLQEYGESVESDPCSLLVHVDGTRTQQGGVPVAGVGSVFLDMALKHDLPVIPVKFAGGLPLTAGPQRLEFPFELGMQDYFLGKAILPDELRELPYALRSQMVAGRINALGPTGSADHPLPGDPELNTAVKTLMEQGEQPVSAVLRAVLDDFPATSTDTATLLGMDRRAPAKDPIQTAALEILRSPKGS